MQQEISLAATSIKTSCCNIEEKNLLQHLQHSTSTFVNLFCNIFKSLATSSHTSFRSHGMSPCLVFLLIVVHLRRLCCGVAGTPARAWPKSAAGGPSSAAAHGEGTRDSARPVRRALKGELRLNENLHASTLPWSLCMRLIRGRLMDGGSNTQCTIAKQIQSYQP